MSQGSVLVSRPHQLPGMLLSAVIGLTVGRTGCMVGTVYTPPLMLSPDNSTHMCSPYRTWDWDLGLPSVDLV